MRKLAIVLAGMMVSGLAMAGISGTPHDMRTFAGAAQTADTQLCVYCHTPHNSIKNNPLWSHTASAATYTAYANLDTLDSTPTGFSGADTNVSVFCMNCHDGTVSVDSAVGLTAAAPAALITGSALVGTALTNDHPVNFTYDAALAGADTELASPLSTDWVDAAGSLPLFNGTMQCATCHDVHTQNATSGNFLIIANSNSTLCTTCHQK